MNARYHCLGCREFKHAPAYRKVGLGGVCSDVCQMKVVGKARARTVARPRNDIPDGTRRAVMVRDRARCRWCGVPGRGVHLHHIAYRSEGVDHSATNLIALCPTHHDVVHSAKKRWKPVLLATIEHIYAGRHVTVPQVERWLLASHAEHG